MGRDHESGRGRSTRAEEDESRAAEERRDERVRAVQRRLDRRRFPRLVCLCRGRHAADLRRLHGTARPRDVQPLLRLAREHLRDDPGGGRRARRRRPGRPSHLVAVRCGARRLQRRQPAPRDLLAVRRRSLPVDRRPVLPGLLPAHPGGGADGGSSRCGTRTVGPGRARRDDPRAGLRRLLLVLRDPAHGDRRARPRRAQVRAGAGLHRAQLRRAARVRRAADALGRRAARAPGPVAPHARLFVDGAR